MNEGENTQELQCSIRLRQGQGMVEKDGQLL